MQSIVIQTIPHEKQRYDTVGDWINTPNDGILISISDMRDSRFEFLVALHELIEVTLCKLRGISEVSVDKFDIDYEKKRKPGDDSEPGDDPDAPYKDEHFFATNLERQMAHEMGVDWNEYEKAIYSL